MQTPSLTFYLYQVWVGVPVLVVIYRLATPHALEMWKIQLLRWFIETFYQRTGLGFLRNGSQGHAVESQAVSSVKQAYDKYAD
jgi:hypothetical protein